VLLAIAAVSLFQATLSIPVSDESSTFEILEGNWEIFDGYWGDSDVRYVYIGTLCIADSSYLFIPEKDSFISPEMSQRFGFIEKAEGNLRFEYSEGVENIDPYQTDIILGTISFNGGEGFLIRSDSENGTLCLTSAVSEFELFRIFKPLTPENSGNAN